MAPGCHPSISVEEGIGIVGFRRQRQILQEYDHNLEITRITGSSWDEEGAGGCINQLKFWSLEFHSQGVVRLGFF